MIVIRLLWAPRKNKKKHLPVTKTTYDVIIEGWCVERKEWSVLSEVYE